MICVKRKIWTDKITQPTGRGTCGGSHAKAQMRKTYVKVNTLVNSKVLIIGHEVIIVWFAYYYTIHKAPL